MYTHEWYQVICVLIYWQILKKKNSINKINETSAIDHCSISIRWIDILFFFHRRVLNEWNGFFFYIYVRAIRAFFLHSSNKSRYVRKQMSSFMKKKKKNPPLCKIFSCYTQKRCVIYRLTFFYRELSLYACVQWRIQDFIIQDKKGGLHFTHK